MQSCISVALIPSIRPSILSVLPANSQSTCTVNFSFILPCILSTYLSKSIQSSTNPSNPPSMAHQFIWLSIPRSVYMHASKCTKCVTHPRPIPAQDPDAHTWVHNLHMRTHTPPTRGSILNHPYVSVRSSACGESWSAGCRKQFRILLIPACSELHTQSCLSIRIELNWPAHAVQMKDVDVPDKRITIEVS